MTKLKRFFVLTLILVFAVGSMSNMAYASDVSDKSWTEHETLEAISSAPADFNSEEFILLSSFTIPLQNVIVDAETPLTARDETTEKVVADVFIYQKRNTTQIVTEVTVRTSYWLSALRICSFHVDIQYTDYTDFEIPIFYRTIDAYASNPTNSLTGSTTTVSQISGHTIAVSLKISDLVLDNYESWDPSETYSYSERITIE